MKRENVVVNVTFDERAIHEVYDSGVHGANDLAFNVKLARRDVAEHVSVPADVET
jgi:hypothetical protein